MSHRDKQHLAHQQHAILGPKSDFRIGRDTTKRENTSEECRRTVDIGSASGVSLEHF